MQSENSKDSIPSVQLPPPTLAQLLKNTRLKKTDSAPKKLTSIFHLFINQQ
jgi:hypothetical protein